MIPEAAVEAVRLALEDVPSYCMDDPSEIRKMLEAAAPHMLAEAWEAGEEAGQDNADSNRGHDVEHRSNPYRPTP